MRSSSPERRMAVDLIADAIRVLETPAPRQRNSRLWRNWLSEREREIKFFTNPRKSAFWCELAGLDWEAVVSRLRGRGLFYDASVQEQPLHFKVMMAK